ncbi:MAG: hypothetical protein QOJ95_1421 [Mycobacterium sp.]|nr:hypothetical protein [Mycobacterium sp.]MDT5177223.1 hypothetical protein [Mycobacterium sp.]
MAAEYVSEALGEAEGGLVGSELGGISPSWLADQLDERGVVRLRDLVTAEWLATMRESVLSSVARHGDGDLFITRPDQEIGSPAHQLMSDPELRRLLDEVARLRRPNAGPIQKFECNIPVRNGIGPKFRSNLFHYDPSVLTVVVPIFIPRNTVGRCGELAAFGNKRPFRRFVATHLMEAALTHNPLYRRHLVKKIDEDPQKYLLELHPGDGYVFWGYRQLHGNVICEPGLLRATLVIAFGEVHAGSWAIKAAWRFGRSRRDIGRRQCSPAAPGSAECPHQGSNLGPAD